MNNLYTSHTTVCAAALAASLAPAPAQAAPGSSFILSGDAEVSVVDPIGVQNVAELRFGRIIQPTSGGTLTISSAGAVTEAGGVTGNAISTPQITNGRGTGAFAVFGDPNRFFITYLPNSTIVSNGTSNMTVDQFRANTGFFGLRRFDNTGYSPLLVGARLNVGANQQVGSYSGTYTITVLYL